MESLFSHFDYDLNANTNTQLQTASGMTCYRINNTTQWLEDILTPDQRKQAINLCRRMHLTTVKEGTEAYAAVVEEVATKRDAQAAEAQRKRLDWIDGVAKYSQSTVYLTLAAWLARKKQLHTKVPAGRGRDKMQLSI